MLKVSGEQCVYNSLNSALPFVTFQSDTTRGTCVCYHVSLSWGWFNLKHPIYFLHGLIIVCLAFNRKTSAISVRTCKFHSHSTFHRHPTGRMLLVEMVMLKWNKHCGILNHLSRNLFDVDIFRLGKRNERINHSIRILGVNRKQPQFLSFSRSSWDVIQRFLIIVSCCRSETFIYNNIEMQIRPIIAIKM